MIAERVSGGPPLRRGIKRGENLYASGGVREQQKKLENVQGVA